MEHLFLVNAKSFLLARGIQRQTFKCIFYVSGSLLLLWLGEPEVGAVRVSLFLNIMFVNCCLYYLCLCLYIYIYIYIYISSINMKRDHLQKVV